MAQPGTRVKARTQVSQAVDKVSEPWPVACKILAKPR